MIQIKFGSDRVWSSVKNAVRVMTEEEGEYWSELLNYVIIVCHIIKLHVYNFTLWSGCTYDDVSTNGLR